MAKHRVVISIFILVFVLGILLFLSWVSLSQRKLVAYDPGSYSPEGLKALNLLLQKSGYDVAAAYKLPDNHQKLLILITTGLTIHQQRKILDWVNAGGTIVELNSTWPSLEGNHHHLSRMNSQKGRSFPVHQPIHLPATLKYHLSGGQVAVKLDPDQGFYGFGRRYFIYRQSYGAGQMMIWNDLGGLTNRFLKRYPDNAVIFVSLLREFSSSTGVYFYNLAFQDDDVSATGWKPAGVFNHNWGGGLLLGFGIIILIWKLAVRFGRPHPLVLARGRSYDEFVYSMAGLFQRAKIEQFVLDNLWCDLLRIMAELTRLPLDTPPEQLVSAVSRLTGKEYQPILKLYSAKGDSSRKLSLKHFLAIASKLDAYRKEFLAWKKSNPFASR